MTSPRAKLERPKRERPKGDRPGVDRPITKDDIRASLRDIAGPIDRGVDQAKGVGLAAVVAVGAILAIGAYLLGRRRGRKRSTLVEIRRIG
jgi:hypothetical protein